MVVYVVNRIDYDELDDDHAIGKTVGTFHTLIGATRALNKELETAKRAFGRNASVESDSTSFKVEDSESHGGFIRCEITCHEVK